MSEAIPLPASDVAREEPRVDRGPDVALRSAIGGAVIAATVLASNVGFLDAYVINVAVPAIGRSLGASIATLQWTLTGYLVTVAALLLLSGALADRFGRMARRSRLVALGVRATQREPQLLGRTVVVIGGSAGLGLETSPRLAPKAPRSSSARTSQE